MAKRVVVTGLGVLSPVGIGWENYWKNLVAGQSGIGPITAFDASGYDSRIAGEVKGFIAEEYLDRKDARKFDRFLQFAVAAARLALSDAALPVTEESGPRIGVIIGSGIGGMITFESQHKVLLERGPNKISPFFIPTMIANMAAGTVGIQFGLKGPNMAIVTACATGASSIGAAFDCIRLGRADAMLAGRVEATITPMAVAGFCAMKAMSTRNDAPEQASRPFDRARDGFVIAEGAGALVLELSNPRRHVAPTSMRKSSVTAAPRTRITVDPDSNGGGVGRAMKAALADAGLRVEQIDHINAHATSTRPVTRPNRERCRRCLASTPATSPSPPPSR